MIRGRHALVLALLLVLFLPTHAYASVLTISTNSTDVGEPTTAAISSNFTEQVTLNAEGFSCRSSMTVKFSSASKTLFSYLSADIISCKATTGGGEIINSESTSIDSNKVITCTFDTGLGGINSILNSAKLIIKMSGNKTLADTSTTWNATSSAGSGESCPSTTPAVTMKLLAPLFNVKNSDTSTFPAVYLGDNVTLSINTTNAVDATHTGKAASPQLTLTSYNATAFSISPSFSLLTSPFNASASYVSSFTLNQTPAASTGNYNITFFANETTGYHNSTFVRAVALVNLSLENNISLEDRTFGQATELKAKVSGNATAIESVSVNVSYVGVENGQLVTKSQLIPMQVKEYSGSSYIYNASYFVNSSYEHNVTYQLTETYQYTSTESPRQKTLNTTVAFFVPPATLESSISFPGTVVLENQSGVLNLTITATNGDVRNLNITLNTTDHTTANVTSSLTQNQNAHLANTESVTFSWNASYISEGSIKVNVTLVAENRTETELLDLLVVKPSLSIEKSTANISDSNTIEVGVIGNITSVQNVNFFFENQLTSESVEQQLSSVFRIDPASVCLKNIVSGESQDIANSQNATAVANNGGEDYTDDALSIGASLAIDGSTTTKWLGKASSTENALLNITFNKAYTLSRISFLWDDVSNGNVSVLYYDHDLKAWQTALANQNPPNSAGTTAYDSFNPFTTDMLSIVVHGQENVLIYDLEVYPVAIETVGNCYIYQYVLNQTGLSSGTNVVNVTAETQTNTSSSSDEIFINFGTAQISFVDGLSSSEELAFVNTDRNLTYQVTAIGGDIRNVDLNLSIEDSNIVNFSASAPLGYSIGFVPSSTSQLFIWQLRGGDSQYAENTTLINTTANSTSSQGAFSSLATNVTLNVADLLSPEIHSISLDRNLTNLQDIVIVSVNVSDNIRVDQVIVEIERNDSVKANVTRNVNHISGIVNVTFDNSTHLSLLSNYTVRAYANDLIGNSNSSPSTAQFNTSSLYTIDFTNNNTFENVTIYNRGESLNFVVFDVNNKSVSSIVWNVSEAVTNTLTGNTTNDTVIYAQTNSTYSRSLLQNETVGNYTLNLNASKNGNSAVLSVPFNVTDILKMSFENTFSSPYSVGERLGVSQVLLKKYREDENITGATITLFCPNLNQSLSEANFGTLYQYADTCTAPSTSATQFVVNANTTFQNNTGSVNITLSTESADTPSAGGGGGGGGESSGGGLSGGSSSSQAADKRNFELHIHEEDDSEVISGKNLTVILELHNTGDTSIGINLSSFSICCHSSLQEFISLKIKEETAIPLLISVPLSTEAGIHEVLLSATSNDIEKSTRLLLSVIRPAEFEKLEELKQDIKETEEIINLFESLGLDMSEEQAQLQAIKNAIASVKEIESENNLAALVSLTKELSSKTSSLERAVFAKKTLYYIAVNKWSIILGLTGFIASMLYMYLYGVPYFIAGSRVHALNATINILVNTRKATEKQYFTRQIDEATFGNIMAKEQDKILKSRSLLKEYMDILERLKSGHSVSLKKMPSIDIESATEKKKSKYQQFLESMKNNNAQQPLVKKSVVPLAPTQKQSLFQRLFHRN